MESEKREHVPRLPALHEAVTRDEYVKQDEAAQLSSVWARKLSNQWIL